MLQFVYSFQRYVFFPTIYSARLSVVPWYMLHLPRDSLPATLVCKCEVRSVLGQERTNANAHLVALRRRAVVPSVSGPSGPPASTRGGGTPRLVHSHGVGPRIVLRASSIVHRLATRVDIVSSFTGTPLLGPLRALRGWSSVPAAVTPSHTSKASHAKIKLQTCRGTVLFSFSFLLRLVGVCFCPQQ